MFTWLFIVFMDAVMEVKMEMGRRGESGDCLVSCMQMCEELEEELRAMMGHFFLGE